MKTIIILVIVLLIYCLAIFKFWTLPMSDIRSWLALLVPELLTGFIIHEYNIKNK